MTTLRMLAQQLTETHLTRHGDRIGKVPALLTELREHVSQSTHEGGGNGSKQRVLVNAAALDLLNTITNEARSAYSDRYGQPAPTIDTSIKLLAESEHPPEWEQWLTELLQGISSRIEQLLRPRKLRRLDSTPCPACGQTFHGAERETALWLDCYTGEHRQLRPIQEWVASCQACGAQWQHGEMKWLLTALA